MCSCTKKKIGFCIDIVRGSSLCSCIERDGALSREMGYCTETEREKEREREMVPVNCREIF